MDIKKIISFIDSYLAKTDKECIDPVIANALLKKAGILNDSNTRPGKPLRDILRRGDIAHAYQLKGANSSWQIPHSKRSPVIKHEATMTKPETKNLSTGNTSTLIELDKYEDRGQFIFQIDYQLSK